MAHMFYEPIFYFSQGVKVLIFNIKLGFIKILYKILKEKSYIKIGLFPRKMYSIGFEKQLLLFFL